MSRRASSIAVLIATVPLLMGAGAQDECQLGPPDLVVIATVTAIDPPTGTVAINRHVHVRVDSVELGDPAIRDITFLLDEGHGARDLLVGERARFALQRQRPVTASGPSAGEYVAWSCYTSDGPTPVRPQRGCAHCGAAPADPPWLAAVVLLPLVRRRRR